VPAKVACLLIKGLEPIAVAELFQDVGYAALQTEWANAISKHELILSIRW
jgi:hypothetical protein